MIEQAIEIALLISRSAWTIIPSAMILILLHQRVVTISINLVAIIRQAAAAVDQMIINVRLKLHVMLAAATALQLQPELIPTNILIAQHRPITEWVEAVAMTTLAMVRVNHRDFMILNQTLDMNDQRLKLAAQTRGLQAISSKVVWTQMIFGPRNNNSSKNPVPHGVVTWRNALTIVFRQLNESQLSSLLTRQEIISIWAMPP